MASQRQTGQGTTLDIEKFLAKHPEIRIGREELDKARDEVPDPGNTWDFLSKPFSNMVLIQQYDADTKDRLWAVALLNDAKAEAHYDKEFVQGTSDCAECVRQQEEKGPEWCLFTRDPKPDHKCK